MFSLSLGTFAVLEGSFILDFLFPWPPSESSAEAGSTTSSSFGSWRSEGAASSMAAGFDPDDPPSREVA